MTKPYEIYLSGDYLARNPTWDEEDSPWKAGQVLKVFDRSHLTPNNIVEVGCGAGGILAALHDFFPKLEYYGFDISPDASKFWEKYNSKNINFFVEDFVKSAETHFDVLLLLDVIEHLPNPFEFLSSLKGRANFYIFHLPLDLSSMSVLREKPLLSVRNKVGHIHYFTKGLALSLIQESGFQVLDWFYTGASFTAPQVSWKTKLARIPRRLVYAVNRDWGVRLLGGETLMILAKARQDEIVD